MLRRTLLALLLACPFAAPSLGEESVLGSGDRLVVCGWDEVYVIEAPKSDFEGEPKKLWSWKAADCETLPEPLRSRFGTTDECKPVDGGNLILIASSGGACAIVEPATGKALWHAEVPNAHSIEWTMGSRVVAAASTAGAGNRLILFDYGPSSERLWEDDLHSAHGVVWDNERKRLWALGFDELRQYEPVDWRSMGPKLKLVATYELPDEGGHDLQAVPGSDDLVLTTHAGVWRFDREKLEFRPDGPLAELAHVKCVSHHPTSGRVAVVQASDEVWWSDTIRLSSPDAKIVLPGERIYKVRWLVDKPEPPAPERPLLESVFPSRGTKN